MAKHQQRPPRLHGAGETLGGISNSLSLLLLCSTLEHGSVVVIVISIVAAVRPDVGKPRLLLWLWNGHFVCLGNLLYCISVALYGLSATAQDELWGCREDTKLWVPHPWKCPRPDLMGPGQLDLYG